MKKMSIYEPAMCCSTGLCGVGVELNKKLDYKFIIISDQYNQQGSCSQGKQWNRVA